MKIYFAHPYTTYGDKDENVKSVEKLIIEVVKKHKDVTPVSPLHATGFLLDYTTYDEGMRMCYDLLKSCDVLCLCGEWQKSKGANLEFEYAKSRFMPIIEYSQLERFLAEY